MGNRYLNCLSEHVCRKTCALLIDCYKAYSQEKVKAKAERLGIEWLYILSSRTSLYQSLNRFVFGILKKKLTPCKIEVTDSDYKKRNSFVFKTVSDIWKKLQEDVIVKA